MVEDTYTRLEEEDNRTPCERVGHNYIEVNSRTKTKLERVTWTEEEDSFSHGFCDGVPIKVDREHSKWMRRSIEVVTYRCFECGKTDVREC